MARLTGRTSGKGKSRGCKFGSKCQWPTLCDEQEGVRARMHDVREGGAVVRMRDAIRTRSSHQHIHLYTPLTLHERKRRRWASRPLAAPCRLPSCAATCVG